jgi:2-polyprenyl-6-hydroxyphenyl methylase/3-demethylubiquinone-9 3-methyltransferase
MFIKPRELRSLLQENRLLWKDHQGIKPDISVPRILRYLRLRAGGRMSYRDLGEKIQMIEGRSKAVLYMGYAIK